MELIWKDCWNTGIDTIDAQHRSIMNYINQLGHVALGRKPQVPTLLDDDAAEAMHYAAFFGSLATAEFGYVLDEFIRCVEDHFAHEEQLHVEDTYQLSAPHKETHDLFLVRIKKYQADYNQGVDNAEKLFRILNKWIEQHIAYDMDLMASVKRCRLSDGV
ncbi:MAG: hemerythrin domain-containing protein [Gallionella sp.]|nr:hemerythrin domain-containing protein [Gallionella sp.]MDD4957719.1 hemerythrin domain-containing protein [Gallionella sp.]